MALHLIRRYGHASVMLDPECQAVLATGLRSGTLGVDAAKIAPLLARGPLDEARFLVCDTPNADGGAAWGYVRAWHESGRLGRDAHVVFTGHMTAHARGICSVPGDISNAGTYTRRCVIRCVCWNGLARNALRQPSAPSQKTI